MIRLSRLSSTSSTWGVVIELPVRFPDALGRRLRRGVHAETYRHRPCTTARYGFTRFGIRDEKHACLEVVGDVGVGESAPLHGVEQPQRAVRHVLHMGAVRWIP